MTKRRLALFLDGTWNTVASATNVSLLHGLVADADGEIAQLRYYDPGVGTGRLQGFRGGAFGFGLGRNVVEAYEWLVRNYRRGDEIYIFGFSRGAYTARSVAGLIAKCGLLHDLTEVGAAELFGRYQKSAEMRPIYALKYLARHGGDLTGEERELLQVSRRVPIKMVAVWDTVGSLGIPFGNLPGLSRRRFRFHHTRLSNLFEHAYHALAIDEHRADFAPTTWTNFIPKVPDPPQPYARRKPIVEQRWFVGAHADVGGGSGNRLQLRAARWLAENASAAGLRFRSLPEIPDDANLEPVSDSFAAFMWGLYRLLKFNRRFHRVIGADPFDAGAGHVHGANETIDGSVFERIRADPQYEPPSLVEWAARRGVDIYAIAGDIDAGTGQPVAAAAS